MNIDDLLKQQDSLTNSLQKQLQDTKSFGRTEDTRFWKPTPDTAGNAYAVIRFLPPPPNPNFPNGIEPAFFVRMYNYGFQGPTGEWYIEKSRRTIGEEDPVNDFARKLYASKIQANIDKAKKIGQRTRFVSNIIVIEDPAKPENNGKVFLYEYGKKIFEMIMDKMNPQFPDEPKINVFDLMNGANFRVKVRKVEGFPNYDRCEFAERGPLLGGDKEKLGAVWKQCHSLQEFLNPNQFKSYDELEKKFLRVMGMSPAMASNPKPADSYRDAPASSPPLEEPSVKPSSPGPSAPPPMETGAGSDDDDLEFFKSIASGSR